VNARGEGGGWDSGVKGGGERANLCIGERESNGIKESLWARMQL
jgi:hypothetical protein